MCTHTTMCIQDGSFALYVASQEGHDRIVEMLLQAGATVDLQDKVENCLIVYLSLVVCSSFHCTLSTIQQSEEYEG